MTWCVTLGPLADVVAFDRRNVHVENVLRSAAESRGAWRDGIVAIRRHASTDAVERVPRERHWETVLCPSKETLHHRSMDRAITKDITDIEDAVQNIATEVKGVGHHERHLGRVKRDHVIQLVSVIAARSYVLVGSSELPSSSVIDFKTSVTRATGAGQHGRSWPSPPYGTSLVGELSLRDVSGIGTWAASRNSSPECVRHRGRCKPGSLALGLPARVQCGEQRGPDLEHSTTTAKATLSKRSAQLTSSAPRLSQAAWPRILSPGSARLSGCSCKSPLSAFTRMALARGGAMQPSTHSKALEMMYYRNMELSPCSTKRVTMSSRRRPP